MMQTYERWVLDRIVEQALSLPNLNLPAIPPVRYIRWWHYVDSVGEPALRIVVVLDDRITRKQRHWNHLSLVSERIHDALLANGVDLFPYTRFITESRFQREEARGILA